MQISSASSVDQPQFKSECAQRCYDNKWTIVGSVFTGVFGGGLVVALTSSAENAAPPVFVATATVGVGIFGALLGGTLGKVADLMLSRNSLRTGENA